MRENNYRRLRIRIRIRTINLWGIFRAFRTITQTERVRDLYFEARKRVLA